MRESNSAWTQWKNDRRAPTIPGRYRDLALRAGKLGANVRRQLSLE